MPATDEAGHNRLAQFGGVGGGDQCVHSSEEEPERWTGG